MTSEEVRDLPTLRRWLAGLDNHPLCWFFESRRTPERVAKAVYAWWRNPILTAVEETLVVLEGARPVGLPTKKRELRSFTGLGQRAMATFMPFRSELIVASLLAEAGIPFRFNTAAGCDLLVGYGPSFGVEISSRSPRSLSDLSNAIADRFAERGPRRYPSISTDPIPPVAIRTEVRNEILDQLFPSDGSAGARHIRVMAAPARPEEGIPASWVTIDVNGRGLITTQAPYNSAHMVALAQHVAEGVLREDRKIRQAQALPTVLIVDLSSTDLPDIRTWSLAFQNVWESTDSYLAIGAMVAHMVRREPTVRFSINPFADPRSVKAAATTLAASPILADLLSQTEPTKGRGPRPRPRPQT